MHKQSFYFGMNIKTNFNGTKKFIFLMNSGERCLCAMFFSLLDLPVAEYFVVIENLNLNIFTWV